MMRRSPTRILFFLALCAIAAVGACSLNPQPIPPGEQADGGDNSSFGGGDGLTGDAGTSNPAPGDSGTKQDLDASDDASDASDAGSEDAGDAEADADAS